MSASHETLISGLPDLVRLAAGAVARYKGGGDLVFRCLDGVPEHRGIDEAWLRGGDMICSVVRAMQVFG